MLLHVLHVHSLDVGITLIAFDAPSPRNPKNIGIYLIFLETRITGLHFAADSMGLSSFKFFWWAP